LTAAQLRAAGYNPRDRRRVLTTEDLSDALKEVINEVASETVCRTFRILCSHPNNPTIRLPAVWNQHQGNSLCCRPRTRDCSNPTEALTLLPAKYCGWCSQPWLIIQQSLTSTFCDTTPEGAPKPKKLNEIPFQDCEPLAFLQRPSPHYLVDQDSTLSFFSIPKIGIICYYPFRETY
jgi:hypothetical protein